MKFKPAAQIVIGGVILIAFLSIILDFLADKGINFLLPLGISFILSAFVGEVIEKFTENFFKERYLSFPIWKFQVNIPVMLILTILIKYWWFG